MLIGMPLKLFSSIKLHLKLLIIASLFAMIPVFLLGITSYLISAKGLQEEVAKANRETMMQIQERIDQKLRSIDKVVLNSTIHLKLDNFLYQQDSYEYISQFKDLATVLRSMQFLMDDVNSVYLYNIRDNTVISADQGLVGMETLPQAVQKTLINADQPLYWLDFKTDGSLDRGSHTVTLIRQIPINSKTPLGYLIVNINDRAFFQVYQDVSLGKNGELLILTPSGNIFSDWHKNLLKGDLKSYSFINELRETVENEKMFTTSAVNRTVMVNYIISPYNQWKYISVVPPEDVLYHLNSIKKTTIILCMILIAMSFSAALFLSQKLRKIVQNILNSIKFEEPVPEAKRKMDELGLIRYYLESLNSINRNLKSEVLETKSLLRAEFEHSLLTEQLSREDIERNFTYFNIKTVSPLFTVMCLKINNLEGWASSDAELCSSAVMNICWEISGHYGESIIIKNMLDEVNIIVNHRIPEEDLHTKVLHMAEEIRDAIEHFLKIKVTIGIGHCNEGVDQIRRSYKEAINVLSYGSKDQCGAVIYIDHANPDINAHKYPVKIEHLIIINMKMGNLEQICDLLDQFSQHLNVDNLLLSEYSLQSFFQLVAVSLRELYDIDPEGGPSVFSYSPYEHISELRLLDKILHWLKQEMYPQIIRHILKCRVHSDEKTFEKVLDYIHQNYDKDLSQAIIAEKVAIPVSLFSRRFKEKTGVTFIDYIISYRMEKAKELLVGTDLKVGDIARQMQYNNSQNFIRVFKQIIGMTPGEYRAQHIENKKLIKFEKSVNE